MNSAIIITPPDQYQIMLHHYVEILEKTNQQLSLWTNPYGLMVGILTLIIAIFAVAVTIYLWRNSRDQKELQLKSVEEFQASLKKQADTFLDQIRLQIEQQITDFERIKSSVAEEKKADFDKIIKELQDRKNGIANVKYENHLTWNPNLRSMYCCGCGRQFNYKDEHSFSQVYSHGSRKVYCTHCGEENII